MALLKREVRMGPRNGVRSLMIIGLILKMSFALFGLILFMILVTFSVVVCWSSKGGCLLSSGSCMICSSWCGMV